MSEQKKQYTVYPFECPIVGTLVKIDDKVATSGNRFATLFIETSDTYKGVTTKQTFEVTAFAKSLESSIDGKMAEGDAVEITVRLKSDEYKGKNYLKAFFSRLVKVVAVPDEAKAIKESASHLEATDDSQPLPF